MIIYNETIIVDESICKEWLYWMQASYIPAVMATGCFDSYRILNVMDSPNEGATYCIQYQAKNIENYSKFNISHQQRLWAKHQQQFENKFVMFNTLMQAIS